MQQITISGRIGGDAELRSTQGGDNVTSFNLAVDQGYGEKKVTNWFRVSVWGKKGAGAQPYLIKGGVVTVVGELEITEYNGKQQLNVRASDFTLPAKSGDRQQGRQESRSFGKGQEGHIPGWDDDDGSGAPF